MKLPEAAECLLGGFWVRYVISLIRPSPPATLNVSPVVGDHWEKPRRCLPFDGVFLFLS